MRNHKPLLILKLHSSGHILLLKTTLSEKIALPATNPTAAMIGRLIVAPAMPVDIPISIDRPKVNNITTKAYQLLEAPYNTVAMQPVHTLTPLCLSFRQNGHWIVLFSIIATLDRFPTIAGFNKIHGTISSFIHPFHTRERAFIHP